MTTKNISDLGAATAFSGTDNLLVWQGSTLAAAGTMSQLSTYIGGSFQPLSSKLTAYAGGDTPSAFTLGIVDAVDAAAWRTAIGAGTSTVTPAALTKTDDTNVTLTLGGTPSTAMLQATSITVGWSGTLAATRGGTGQSSYAVGDLLYASTTTALSKLADVATGNALISGGVGVAPSYGKIGLTTHISGTLAVGNGGTGATTLTGYVKGAGTSALTASSTIPNTDITGLGTMSTQNDSAVAITGGTITGITDLAVADGGTGSSTASGARTNLGLVIGTDVQPQNANLSAVAGLTTAADQIIYWTGVSTASTTSLTTFGRSLIDDVDASAARTTLGLGTAATQNTGTSGATIPLLNGANTFSTTQSILGGNLTVRNNTGTLSAVTVTGDGANAALTLNRYSTNASGAQVSFNKGRGDPTTPTDVATSDVIGLYLASGYAGGAFRNSSSISFDIIDPSPSSTSMAGRIRLGASAVGSTTSGSIAYFDNALITTFAILQPNSDNVYRLGGPSNRWSAVYSNTATFSGAVDVGSLTLGSNSVIDANRAFVLREYTVATLPTVGTTRRLVAVTDALAPTWNATLVGGGAVKCLAFDNGTNWTAH